MASCITTKALSIKQPWATLIALGLKDIENRMWKTNFRGRFLIHTSAKAMALPKNRGLSGLFTPEQWELARPHIQGSFKNLPLSAIIGEVDLVDCVQEHPSVWAEKLTVEHRLWYESQDLPVKPIWNWVLENAEMYEKPKYYVRGKLGFWEHVEDQTKIIKRLSNG